MRIFLWSLTAWHSASYVCVCGTALHVCVRHSASCVKVAVLDGLAQGFITGWKVSDETLHRWLESLDVAWPWLGRGDGEREREGEREKERGRGGAREGERERRRARAGGGRDRPAVAGPEAEEET